MEDVATGQAAEVYLYLQRLQRLRGVHRGGLLGLQLLQTDRTASLGLRGRGRQGRGRSAQGLILWSFLASLPAA